MNWYRKRTKGDSKETNATVLASGNINLNASTHKQFILDEKGNPRYKFVLFGFDPQTRTVGIKLLKEKEEGAYAIRGTKSGATVSAKAFLKEYEIDHKESQSYLVKWDEALEALVLTLKEQSPSKD